MYTLCTDRLHTVHTDALPLCTHVKQCVCGMKKQVVSVRLSEDVVEQLNSRQEGRAACVEQALRLYFEREAESVPPVQPTSVQPVSAEPERLWLGCTKQQWVIAAIQIVLLGVGNRVVQGCS